MDLTGLNSRQLVDVARRLETLSRKLHALSLEVVREIDQRGVAGELGCTSTAAVLRDALRLTPGAANRRVKDADALYSWTTPTGIQVPPELPVTAQALRNGELTPDHVQVIRDTVRKLPDEIRDATKAGVERALVEESGRYDATVVAKIATQMLNALDPDGTLQDEKEARRRRELTFAPDTNGMVKVGGRLDHEGAALVQSALSPLTKPQGKDDLRSGPRRQADALVELARQALDTGTLPTEGGERPHLTLTMSLNDFVDGVGTALTGWQGPISAELAEVYACDCRVTCAAFGPQGQPLGVSQSSYVVRGPVRRMLIARDRGCGFPGCDRPPQWCAAHHVIAWPTGPSTIGNLVLLCHKHHQVIHESDWIIQMIDGRPQFIPPAWVCPDRIPRTNILHRAA